MCPDIHGPDVIIISNEVNIGTCGGVRLKCDTYAQQTLIGDVHGEMVVWNVVWMYSCLWKLASQSTVGIWRHLCRRQYCQAVCKDCKIWHCNHDEPAWPSSLSHESTNCGCIRFDDILPHPLYSRELAPRGFFSTGWRNTPRDTVTCLTMRCKQLCVLGCGRRPDFFLNGCNS